MRTVQEVLENALERVRGEATPLVVAGRTDAGVHARGQVASHAGAPVPARALNGLLPPDLRVLESAGVPEGFDARREARSRTYRYRLETRPAASVFERGLALHHPRPLDRAALDASAAALVGTHDFTAFTPTETDHVRFERDILRAEWRQEGDHHLDFWIEADTFMRHMVRILVGTMLEFQDPDRIATLLTGAPRSEAGRTARPHGLYLEHISY